ncbi:MAG TPA: trehalase family glycosidase [Candidatus Saccharimonadales bacterium]|nr:trehalase family glycosidase [Candidatus Saccharimonadales bacterium]
MDDGALVELLNKAVGVLQKNDRKKWTVPAGDLYPHQWLWDSCFVSIGLRHIDIDRAQTELKSLIRGQWSNGMIPNLIFSNDPEHRRHIELWRSYLSPYAPHEVATSGITQPPILAEAVVQIGKKLKLPDKRSWYKQMYSTLLRYHEWLYADRDPHGEGLIILIHPYESGMDNSPPWISELRKHNMPWWISLIEKLHLDGIANLVRRDTRHVPPGQRMSNIEAMAYWAAIHRLRRKAYNSEAILSRSLFAVEDLGFNSILIKANSHLRNIAKDIGHKVPDVLLQKMQKTESALEKLWDERTGQYYSRSFVSNKLIEEPSIATLLPLYSGGITKERAGNLVKLLKLKRLFDLKWPVPSVPQTSDFFNPYKYWQGPTWVNTNWLIIEGLRNYGFSTEAEELKARTLELVSRSGMNEYFNPLDGEPAGAANFSWTAALTIDLLKQ